MSESIALSHPIDIIPVGSTQQEAAEHFIATIRALMAEVADAPDFLGINIEVHRLGSELGQIGCIRLVPVDNIGGVAAKRVE